MRKAHRSLRYVKSRTALSRSGVISLTLLVSVLSITTQSRSGYLLDNYKLGLLDQYAARASLKRRLRESLSPVKTDSQRSECMLLTKSGQFLPTRGLVLPCDPLSLSSGQGMDQGSLTTLPIPQQRPPT